MYDLVLKTIRIIAAGALALFVLAMPAMANDHDDMGAFIREGSCDQPGKVIEDIGDLEPEDDIWLVIGQGEPEPRTVYGEDEGISESIDDLISAGSIVTVHEKDDSNARVIACGKIDGAIDTDGTLSIDLKEVDRSGFAGRVHFGPSDDEDEQTEVTTGVWQSTSGATPAATPMG